MEIFYITSYKCDYAVTYTLLMGVTGETSNGRTLFQCQMQLYAVEIEVCGICR